MTDVWLPCSEVWTAVRGQYPGTNRGASDARKALLDRLASEQMSARADAIELRGEVADEIVRRRGGSQLGSGQIKRSRETVPAAFWLAVKRHTAIFPYTGFTYREDWMAGDFELASTARSGEQGYSYGRVENLEILNRGLPVISCLPRSAAAAVSKGGRGAAQWWPAFAEELAVYIHENGVPDGAGHAGQSAIYEAVAARMQERGCEEPSRTAVQGVINSVLDRLRK